MNTAELRPVGVTAPASSAALSIPSMPASRSTPCRAIRVGTRFRPAAARTAAIVVAVLVLAALPGRSSIAPLVESDYCYTLLAAERLATGRGLTSLDPVAPFQPWEYRADFVFLTKWPAGYPLLVAGVRVLSGVTTLNAACGIALACCAVALVGWFTWARRVVSGRWMSIAAGGVAASASVSVAALVNPRTDTLIVAALPWILCLAQDRLAGATGKRGVAGLALLGVVCGALFWIRYAAIFVPIGVGAAVFVGRLHGRFRRRGGIAFVAGCAAPIVALLAVNRIFGPGDATVTQLNLGGGIDAQFSWALLARAWRGLTDFGLYPHRPEAAALCAAAPAALIAALLLRFGFAGAREALRHPAVTIGLAVIAALLAELVLTTALFAAKYDYVGLSRYYEPVRPILAVLCIAAASKLVSRTDFGGASVARPVGILSKLGQAAVLVAMLPVLHWNVFHAWARPFERWRHARQDRAPSGAWAQAFAPDASGLYAWLARNAPPDVVVFSNFHDYLGWELGVPALPIPPDEDTLSNWLDRAARRRGVEKPRAVFALARDNAWRDHALPAVADVIRTFRLRLAEGASSGDGWAVYESALPDPATSITTPTRAAALR
ncbi:MAG: hypothetical protein FLDDKLPJ_02582 [Phycisphaerae bacterium]|nr:hypothetical protein [Phycisphaerae bacterium]